MLSNKAYDTLKWIAMYLLPALGTLYFALAGISVPRNITRWKASTSSKKSSISKGARLYGGRFSFENVIECVTLE